MSVLIGGVVPPWGGYWRAVIPSLSATFGLLEGESGVGFDSVMRGLKRYLIEGVARGLLLSQNAFSKWNMRKVPIFRAWKSPVLPWNSAVFGKKLASRATIRPESDCSHI